MCQHPFRDSFGKLFPLDCTCRYTVILSVQNCVSEQKHDEGFVPGKTSRVRLGHCHEDPAASVTFAQETVYSAAGRDPRPSAPGKLPLHLHVSTFLSSIVVRRGRICRELGSPVEDAAIRALGDSDGRGGQALRSPTIRNLGAKLFLKSST